MADGILYLFGGAGYLAPMALFAAGAVIVMRPMLPAVHPFKTGALCLVAALTLGLAAGSLGLGPGDAPRDGFFDAAYLREHGGLVGESLFWSSAKLFSEAGSHILFVFLLLAGVLLITGASIAGWCRPPARRATTTERVRRTSAPGRRTLPRLPRRPGPSPRVGGRRPSPRTGAGRAGDPRGGAGADGSERYPRHVRRRKRRSRRGGDRRRAGARARAGSEERRGDRSEERSSPRRATGARPSPSRTRSTTGCRSRPS